jgi:alpha-L-rhamnosidase
MKSFLVILNILFLVSACSLGQEIRRNMPSIQSSMIWSTSEASEKGEYVVFRKSFELADTNATALMELFADSRYLLWINGKYVLRGPCRFYPKRPEYDEVDVKQYLKKGKNTIAILVHTIGNSNNGRIMKHAPGVAVVLKMSGKEILRTDATWKYYNKTMYLPSARSWNTIADVMDARIDNAEWISPDYNDSSWTFAIATDGAQWRKMFPCELPLRKETELRNLRLLPSGEPLSTKLPIELTAGQEALVDFGPMDGCSECFWRMFRKS